MMKGRSRVLTWSGSGSLVVSLEGAKMPGSGVGSRSRRRRWPPTRSAAAGALAFAFLVTANPAVSWPPEMHESLVEAAVLISPAARARVPDEYLGSVIRGAKEADGLDGRCLLHRDPATDAQKMLDFLRRDTKWTNNHALGVGRLLHFAADSILTDALERGAQEVQASLFSTHDFVVFREAAGDLTRPLATSLREAAREARFADDPTGDDALRYRRVVNVLADTLLRLPPLPGVSPAEDGGVGLFVVDTLDTGITGVSVARESMTGIGSRDEGAAEIWDITQPTRSFKGRRRVSAIDNHGIDVIDRACRRDGEDVLSRMTVFNNTALCASQLILSADAWKVEVTLDIPPHAIRLLDVRVPAPVAQGRIKAQFRVSDLCRTKPAVFPLKSYVRVSGTNGAAPRVRDGVLRPFPPAARKP